MEIKINLNADMEIGENTEVTCTQCLTKIKGEKIRKTVSFKVKPTDDTNKGTTLNEYSFLSEEDENREIHHTLLCQKCLNQLNWQSFYQQEVEPKQSQHVISDLDSRMFAYHFSAKHQIKGDRKLTNEEKKILKEEMERFYLHKGLNRYDLESILIDTIRQLEP